MTKKYSGSCLCKKITFEASGEFTGFFFCHCTRCQKQTGSAHCANLFLKNAELKWLSGKEFAKTFRLANTRFAKSFCSECGSSVPTSEKGFLAVPAGSLDCDLDVKPTAHIFVGNKANWEKDLDLVTKYQELPK